MNDQKQLWDKSHQDGGISHYSLDSNDTAQDVIKIIRPNSKVLDLGCGVGNDSLAFAKAGHTVVATDFSDVAISKNSERFKDIPNLNFEVLDISQPFRFETNSFDVVYARLSLHYFIDEITRKIFNEIYRVLMPNGYFCFVCKSIEDPLYGDGELVEENVFQRKGHMRHFFSEEYAKFLLENKFKIQKIETVAKSYDGKESVFINVIATAVK